MSNKEYALQYLKKGLSIIPVKSPAMVWHSQSPEDLIKQCKVPLVSWKEYQTRRPTQQEVESWFSQWPDANIGIVTGKISGIVVFDLDSEHAVQYAEDEGGLPIIKLCNKNRSPEKFTHRLSGIDLDCKY